MTYFMTFAESMKAIRPSDGLRLRMPTKQGTDIEVHLYQAKFRGGPSGLFAVPATPANIAALGLGLDHEEPHPWIIPPFAMMRNAFKKGGPFIRDGKLDVIPLDVDKLAVLRDNAVFRPDLGCFIPQDHSDSLPWGDAQHPLDRSEWTIKMWVTTVVTRPATDEERGFLLVPWTDYSLGFLDLWLEQYRCWHQGLPIPTHMSEPDVDPDFSDSVTETTDTGLTATVTVLDEAAGDDAGKHQLVLECAVGSKLDDHVRSLGYEANGYFFEALATDWARTNDVTGLWLDPTADRIVILGDQGQITALKGRVLALARDFAALGEAVNHAVAAGVPFD